MRGSINYQVNQIFLKSEIFTPGVSKHAEKAVARESGAQTWADLGKFLNVYSYNTAKTYKDVWHQFGHYCRQELGVRDLEKSLTGEHVKSFLESRIADGVRFSTFQKEAAALSKFENAINKFAVNTGSERTYDFRSAMTDVRQEAAQILERFQGTRAYTDPDRLAQNISNDNYRLGAQIQHGGGTRLYETSKIDLDQLSGRGTDPHTGKAVGFIRLDPADTKGGKGRTISISPETYSQLEAHIAQHGEFRISDSNSYRDALKQAAGQSNQEYTGGSHGLRWNYAQERVSELQRAGLTYDQAISQTSWDMGHERADITEHYLK
ncbi:MAG: hypothetical protein Q7J15_09100 [Candidatus Desulfaltia sp.]|nr:hypothetical protein [Candidatus Desulfaltia sp.]